MGVAVITLTKNQTTGAGAPTLPVLLSLRVLAVVFVYSTRFAVFSGCFARVFGGLVCVVPPLWAVFV